MTHPPIDRPTSAADELRDAQAAVGRVGDLLDQATAQLEDPLVGREVTGSDE